MALPHLPKTAYLVDLDPDLLDALKRVKAQTGIPVSAQIRRGCRLWLAAQDLDDRPRPTRLKRAAKAVVALVVAAVIIGCGSPVEPTRAVASADIDPTLVAAVAALDAIETRLPWNGLTFREWRERLNVPIRVAPMADLYGAVWTGSAITFNATLTGYDTHGVAGLLAHELRHADGIAHDCGPQQDHRATPWSAYAVHVWTLEQLGEPEQAKGNEGGFCD